MFTTSIVYLSRDLFYNNIDQMKYKSFKISDIDACFHNPNDLLNSWLKLLAVTFTTPFQIFNTVIRTSSYKQTQLFYDRKYSK